MPVPVLILVIILGAPTALIAFMAVRAALVKPHAPPEREVSDLGIDKNALAAHLAGAVQIPTVSMADETYPEKPFFDYKEYIEKTYPLFAKAAECTVVNKYSLVYRIDGSDANLKPACFLAHIDVVPAPPEGWDYPPFGGEIHDGFVYGRGAQDMKCQMIAVLDALEFTLANGGGLKRAAYCCFGHDEELSTLDGAPEIVKYLDSLNVRPEYVLDEGGVMLDGGPLGVDGTLALIGVCEKGYMDVRLSRKKAGGHASTPAKPTALASVAKAVCNVERKQLPPVWTAPTIELIRELAPYMKPLFKFVMVNRDVLSPFIKFALSKLHPISAALVKTTFAPTMAKGSDAANVLPPYAEAVVNCRLIAGNSPETVLAHIKKVAGRGIDVEVINRAVPASKISPADTPSYVKIADAVRTAFPGVKVAPYMFIAATDSRFYYPICDNVYRFSPFAYTEDDQRRIHAVNERCNIDDLKKATEFFVRIIGDTCL
ncbi:MAG: M20/M25/M40 family metallo-hydrolase [Clostridiales bacterium]|jgi:carboxypeptidase PM20D1|nr:M20/M25/M40 family metallo-hydrolase [Clostridiales bacterium]